MYRILVLVIILLACSSSLQARDKDFVWAVWHNAYKTPPLNFQAQHDQAILNSHLLNLQRLGITRVYFLVKFPTGEVFYRSKIAPMFKKMTWDPFAFIVRRCHELGLEIYPYVNIFPEGGYNEKTKRHDFFGPYLQQHPEHAMLDANGQRISWACPAVPAVVEYELAIIKEIVTQYKIDGLQLDRLRYPYANAGYHPQSVKKYSWLYNKPPREGDPDWIRYRQELLSSFARQARDLIKKYAPGLPVSAAVFPRPYSARINQLQNWPNWCQQGLLDEVVPMSYYRDVPNFKKYLQQELTVYGGKIPFLAGIGTFFMPDTKTLKAQLQFALSQKIQGIVFFNGYDLVKEPFQSVVRECIRNHCRTHK